MRRLDGRQVAVRGAGTLLRVVMAFTVSACGAGVAPSVRPAPVPTAPAEAAPAAPVATRYSVPALVTDTRYRVESVASLERDSAGRRESQRITSRADVTVRVHRQGTGDFSAAGRVRGYAVSSPLTSTPIVIDSLRFNAVLDASALRVVTDPPLANECDRAETGALALVRDLLVRVPAAIAVGDSWRDSTVQIVCRSSVPLIVHTANEYTLAGAERRGDDTELIVRRRSSSRLDGKTSSPWRSVEVSGAGTGTLEARVSLVSGAVRRVEGTATLTLSMSEKSATTVPRSQQVTQRVTYRAEP